MSGSSPASGLTACAGPILIGADIGQAILLASVPVAFFLDLLSIEQLYVVAFLIGTLKTFFDVSYRSYLPSLVRRERLMEANSKLTASESVVEASEFSIGGWIVQLFSAMTAVVIDALSFLASAMILLWIRRHEPIPAPSTDRQGTFQEIADGLKVLWNAPILRVLMGAAVAEGMIYGVVGTVILIFGIRELGIQPGVLGMVFAVGGVSSVIGATLATPISRRIGVGPTIIFSFLVFSVAVLFIPLARGPLIVALTLLAAHQLLGDGFAAIYDINEVSLRQSITFDEMLGRVNASFRVAGIGAFLVGSLLGGTLAEIIGLRLTLVVGAGSGLLGALWLAISPITSLKEPPPLLSETSTSATE